MTELPNGLVTFMFTDIEVQVGLQGVEEASFEISEFTKAEASYREALASAEDMGVVNSMAFAMIKVAETRAAKGSRDEAVEVLACVLAEPVSNQRFPTQETAIGEQASEVLAGLEGAMEPDDYKTAYARGQAKSLGVAAKELLASP